MKNTLVKTIIIVSVFAFAGGIALKINKGESVCLTGAFIADRPLKEDIIEFKKNYGKKPFIVMTFVDWGAFLDARIIKEIYEEDCRLMITWEPWNAADKTAIDYKKLLQGEYDTYINEFAKKLKNINNPVFLRFAHEMNGNWYPWSGTKIGKELYIKIYKYVHRRFEETDANNVKWVFSINAEDVPTEENNHFLNYYPGDKYADYVGIDGYNWGTLHPWSKWKSFSAIFETPCKEVAEKIDRPIMITEFSSADRGGDKALWIKKAINFIKNEKNIKAFILFNIDKEAKWSFSAGTKAAEELKKHLADPYFRDTN